MNFFRRKKPSAKKIDTSWIKDLEKKPDMETRVQYGADEVTRILKDLGTDPRYAGIAMDIIMTVQDLYIERGAEWRPSDTAKMIDKCATILQERTLL